MDLKKSFQKLTEAKKIFSLDFFLKFNWLLTVFFFLIVLFFALWVWWQSFLSKTTPVPTEIVNMENPIDLEEKDRKIKKILEELEKRKENFSNFPVEAQPRERVFKSDFVWEEELNPAQEIEIEKNEENKTTERIML